MPRLGSLHADRVGLRRSTALGIRVVGENIELERLPMFHEQNLGKWFQPDYLRHRLNGFLEMAHVAHLRSIKRKAGYSKDLAML